MTKILKDKKIIALVIILVVFTIGYFIIINKISYSFKGDDLNKISYERTIDIIKESARVYGESNKELFKESKTAYIKVQDLIDAEKLATDETGQIINPINEESLNTRVIKLKLEDDKISVEIDN